MGEMNNMAEKKALDGEVAALAQLSTAIEAEKILFSGDHQKYCACPYWQHTKPNDCIHPEDSSHQNQWPILKHSRLFEVACD